MIDAIILDLDGTLIDTSQGVKSAVIATINELGLECLDDEIINEFVGPPMQLSFQLHFGMGKKDALEAANLFRKIYREEFLYDAEIYPNVLSTLMHIKNAGIRICVATNKSHDNAMSVLEHFSILEICDFAMGSDFGGKLSKTDIIRECCKNINVAPQNCIYIGDSEFDLIGAEENNIDFVAVMYGFDFDDESVPNCRIKDKIYSFDEIERIVFGKK